MCIRDRFTGDVIESGAKELGFKPDFIRVREGMTRINVKVKSNEESEINGLGPVIHDDELEQMFKKLDELEDGDILVLAGSIPATLPSEDVYKRQGLYLCKKLCSKLQLSFYIESKEEEYTKVTIGFPRNSMIFLNEE